MESSSQLYPYYLEHPHVSTDSRKIAEGDLFFALSGPKFDGNAFALQALADGASYAVVSSKELAEREPRCLFVPDTLVALQELARTHRAHLDIPVIGITGTNGKTTTKELTKAVLSRKYNLLATEGNLNNHIGVPLTVLRITKEHEMALVEMGASAPGEIAFLCSIARPTHGLITNVGKAHLEGFGSVEGVLRTKSELPSYLKEHGGYYFLNSDDARLFAKWAAFAGMRYGTDGAKGPVLSCSILRDHPFLGIRIETPKGVFEAETHLTGRYNYQNVLAATSIGLHFDVPISEIKEAVEAYRPSNSRSQVIEWRDGVTVIMDAYNANPSSMIAALGNLAELSSEPKIAILGDMLELGTASVEEHTVLIDWLIRHETISPYLVGGEFAKASNGRFPSYDTSESLVSRLSELEVKPGATILIKGSRGIALEKVLSALEANYK